MDGEENQTAPAAAAAAPATAAAAPTAAAAASPAPKRGLRLRLPRNPVPALAQLSFTSWWTELGTRRYVEIQYDMEQALFRVTLDAHVSRLEHDATDSLRNLTKPERTVLTLRLHERLLGGSAPTLGTKDGGGGGGGGTSGDSDDKGPYLTEFDLHLGVRLNILGRPTTLMQCDLKTANWLEYQSSKLTVVLEAFGANLRKYETVANELPGRIAAMCESARRGKAKTDLRAMFSLIDACHARLSVYRPALADGLLAQRGVV